MALRLIVLEENVDLTFLDGLPDFGGIRDFLPGANNNFGIRKGPGLWKLDRLTTVRGK